MNLKKFIDKKFILETESSKDEISKLFNIVERDIKEASEKSHAIDWQFAIAYNAALQLSTIVLRASGHRASSKTGHHWATFTVLPDLLGSDFLKIANYFNECRAKRNAAEYCDIGMITKKDGEKIMHEVKAFKREVVSWLKKHHPKLVPEKPKET